MTKTRFGKTRSHTEMRELVLAGFVEQDPLSNLEPMADSFDMEEVLAEIRLSWQRAAEGILSACMLFSGAESQCKSSQERSRLAEAMPYSPSKMRTIAEETNYRFRDPLVRKQLPSSFNSIYELALIQRAKFNAAFVKGLIKPEMTGADVASIKGRGPRAQQTGVLLWKLYRDEPLDDETATKLKIRLFALCASLAIRPVEPKPRKPRP